MAGLLSSYQIRRRFILRGSIVELEAAPSFASRSLFFSATPSRALPQQVSEDVVVRRYAPIESEKDGSTIAAAAAADAEGLKSSNFGAIATPRPSLSVREKKELASYAHSLGKKLKSGQIGKSGVSDSVVAALIGTLEANELLKLKVHGTCPGELDDVVTQLEEGTRSVVVGRIGRTVILYRPSMTKLKGEENRKYLEKVQLEKQPMSKKLPQV